MGALLIAFTALIGLTDGILGRVGGWFGADQLTFQELLDPGAVATGPAAGVPWNEATQAGSYIGEKTVLNELVGYASFGPHSRTSPQSRSRAAPSGR